MKKSILLLAVMATLLCLSSCKKEENGKVLFKATIENPAQQGKTSIASDGMMTWRSGDRIVVFYGTSATSMTGQSLLSTTSTGRTAEFTLALGNEPTGGHYYAVYPANIAGMIYHNSINLPTSQEYHAAEGGKVQFDAPMYAYSNDDQLVFKNLCGVVRITLTTPKAINRIVVSANEPLCGQFTVNWNGGEPTLATTSTESTEVEFTCGSGVNCAEGADFYLYLPVNEMGYTGMEFAFYATDGTYSTKTLMNDQRYVVGRNTLNPLVFSNLVFRPVGAIGGLFSVSATQQVCFSQGNLQYQASTNTWRFAEHQYDYVGSANENISSTYSGWIDLFGWGTSGWSGSGAICYQPFATSENGLDYYSYIYGNTYADVMIGTNAEADWAWHNAIKNGGNAAHQWRTLTNLELYYIFNTRPNTTNLSVSNARYAKGMVNNVHGIILFPDGYVHPDGVTIPTGINSTSSTGWNNNSYSSTSWALMESAGAVFLPTAGWRFGTDVYNVGNIGSYWTSTLYGEGATYGISFSDDIIRLPYYYGSSNGFSVRPVRDN